MPTRLFLASWLMLGTPATAASSDYDLKADRESYREFLGDANQPSILEAAGSHGEIGYSVGIGLQESPWSSGSRLLMNNLHQDATPLAGESARIPKVYLVKGLGLLPVDIGLSHGLLEGGRVSQTSGHLQWTVFEASRLPAVAVRAGYGKLAGLSETTMESWRADLAVSYGFLRYFTVSFRQGWQWNKAEYSVANDKTHVYFLGEGTNDERVSEAWMATNRAWGLKVMVLPPFLSVTAEVATTADQGRAIAAKLAFGI